MYKVDASTFNEVEVYTFELNISFNLYFSGERGFGSAANSFKDNTLIGEQYSDAIKRLSNGYSAFDMIIGISTFKKGAAANNDGLYNSYPLRTGKEKIQC